MINKSVAAASGGGKMNDTSKVQKVDTETPQQKQAAAKLALRKQLEKTLLQVRFPLFSNCRWVFVAPGPFMTGSFCSDLLVCSSLLKNIACPEKETRLYYCVFHRFGQAKFAYSGPILSSNQFLLLPKLPQKTKLAS
jgi:hypothetical protein